MSLTGFVAPADAHAIVREAQPAAEATVADAPADVVMRFNEPVELSFGAVRVYDSNGTRVDRGEPRHVGGRTGVQVDLTDDMPDGTYTVTWRVVSSDGHPIEEAFVFHVGAPGARPQGIADTLGDVPHRGPIGVAAGVVRWSTFAALLMLGGAVAFGLVVGPVGRGGVLVVAWVVALVATAAAFVLHGAVAGELSFAEALSPDVLGDVAGTRFGRVAGLRLALLLALPLVARLQAVRIVVTVALLATPGLASHAGTTSPVVANVVADTLHMAAAAAWLGGLVLLVRLRPLADDTVERFSRLATVAVAVLVATGVFRSVVEVGGLSNFDEPYGVLLLAKVAAFLPMVGLGLLNRGRRGSVRRKATAEVALGALVLAVTAALVNTAPARVAAAEGATKEVHVAVGADFVHVVVEPGRVGDNAVELAFGSPSVQEVRVLFRMAERNIGPLVAEAHRVAPGRFVVHGRHLSVAGRWELEIVARTGRFEEARARATVDVD
ncbi:MAG TPA: copper resistance protein CopC [Acidimicrobiales bacterium]|nr:copper resistance protein CopC [Acidimicrobiales bacterium]